MAKIWTTTGLVLCLLIPWNSAYPSPFQKAGEDEDDEIDSDEQEFNRIQQVIVNRLGLKNMTNQELAEKASQFLNQYFAQVGTDNPLKISNARNQTLIITIVPNANGTSSLAGGGGLLIQMQMENVKPEVPPRAVPEKIVEPVTKATTTTTTTTTSARPTAFFPPGNKGSDNIEDAILEALSFVQGQVPSNVAGPDASISQTSNQGRPIKGTSGSSQSQSQGQGSGFPLSAPFPISPKSPENDGTVLAQLLQQQQQQQTIATAPPAPAPLPAPAPVHHIKYEQNTVPPIIFVALPPDATTQRPYNRPQGPNPLFLGLNLFGNLAEGDWGSAVENTIKISETPVVQDTARLAAVGILHNVFQGFNCNIFGNCNRAPLKVIVP